MGSSTAPSGYPRHQLSTLFLRVPSGDWTRVVVGEKREFRTSPREGVLILSARCPTPVVLYTISPTGGRACKLMVLEHQERQRLIDIAELPDALAAEGFATYADFKAYWKKRNGGVFRPLQQVVVHRVRPWGGQDQDGTTFGSAWMELLYGKFFPAAAAFPEYPIA